MAFVEASRAERRFLGDEPNGLRKNPMKAVRSMRSRTTTKLTTAVAAIALVAVSCGGGADPVAAPTTDGPGGPAATSRPPSGDPAPVRQFETFDGETVSLADFTGKPVVLNFWASWCPSCVAEMSAAFRPVQEDLGEDVTFIGMNIQDDRALAAELLEETGVIWVSAEDPNGELYIDLGGIAMPFTVYIGADGTIVDKHNGPLTEGQLRDQIESAF